MSKVAVLGSGVVGQTLADGFLKFGWEVMRGTRDVTADTAIRLGRYFGTDPRFWLNLQAAYDLSKAEKTHSYKKIVPRKVA